MMPNACRRCVTHHRRREGVIHDTVVMGKHYLDGSIWYCRRCACIVVLGRISSAVAALVDQLGASMLGRR